MGGFINLTIRERLQTQRNSVVNTFSTNIKDIYANIGKIRYFCHGINFLSLGLIPI